MCWRKYWNGQDFRSGVAEMDRERDAEQKYDGVCLSCRRWFAEGAY